MRMVTLVFQDEDVMRVAHIMTEYMDDLQNLMWVYIEQFVYFAVWAWRYVIAKSFDAFSEGTVIKDFGVEPLSLFESLGIILCDL